MNHSRVLFVDNHTSFPIRFFMRPSTEKAKLRPLIEHGGGILAGKCLPNTIRLVEPGSRVLTTDSNTVSTKYIWDCVKENQLLDKKKYLVQIRSLNVSDISDDDASARLFVVKTTERNLKSRKDYSHEEDRKIIDYIIKNKRYSDVRGVTLWRNLESTGLLAGHTSQSLRERWRKQIAPKLYTFNLTENQMKSFGVEGGNIKTKWQRKSLTRKKSQQSNTKKEVEKAILDKAVVQISDESDGDFENENNDASTNSETDDIGNESKTSENSYTDRDVWAIFRYIFNNFVQNNITDDSMWVKMERSGITSHSWKSMKDHFFQQVVPNIHIYHLPKFELKRLSTVINIPSKDDSARTSSPDESSDKSFDTSSCAVENNDRTTDAIGENDTLAIFAYIFKHFIYEDVTSDAMWLKMEVEKVTRHSWHSMKDHFFQYMIPNIHCYNVPKLQLRRLASVVTLPEPPKNDQSTSFESTSAKKSNLELHDDCDTYTEEDSEAMLKYICQHLGKYEFTGDTMWKDMERSSVTPHTWKSMKVHFFHHVVPNINHKYVIPKTDLRRLATFVRLPYSDQDELEVEDCDTYTNQNIKDMLKSILGQLNWYKPAGNLMWKNMEHALVTPYTWTSMKFYFFHYVVPRIHQHNLSKADLERLGQLVRLPDPPVPKTLVNADRNNNGPDESTSKIKNSTTKESSLESIRNSSPDKPATRSSPTKAGQSRTPERKSPRRSENSRESPLKSPILNAGEISSTSENSSPKGQTHVSQVRRSLRMNEIGKEMEKESPQKIRSENTGERSGSKSSETSSTNSQTQVVVESSPSLLGSKGKNTRECSPESPDYSPSQISNEVSQDNTGTEVDLSPKTQLRLNSLRQSLVAKMGSKSPSTRSCSATSVVDTLDEHLLGNLRTPILQSMQKRIKLVLNPKITTDSAHVEEVDTADLQLLEHSIDVFKVPEAVVRTPRRKRDASPDICTTTPKSRLTNQENHIPPRNQSPRSGIVTRSTLGERNTLGACDSPAENESEAEKNSPSSNCISTNSIVLMEMAKQDVGDLMDEVGEWFSHSMDSEDGVLVTKQKIQDYYEKLEHLNKSINRALLSARVERIMDKSPNYMSFEDKLAIYKFITFYKT